METRLINRSMVYFLLTYFTLRNALNISYGTEQSLSYKLSYH